MTFNEYLIRAMRTANKDLSDNDQVENSIFGVIGEAGELMNIIKKFLFQGHDLDKQGIREEIGDILWYLALLCDACGFDFDAVAQANIDKLLIRYPTKFDNKRSINRHA